MTPEQEATIRTGCNQGPCHVRGACPCSEDLDWMCRNRHEHWRIPPDQNGE